MRVLLLSFYYPPDLSAGSFRMGALVPALLKQLDENDRLDILTTLPNRYASFTEEAMEEESIGAARIRRFKLPGHQSGMRDQSVAFFHYARNVWRWVKKDSYDLVVATSSRLATAALAARVAKRIEAPLYLDIRDIFTDTLQDLLSGNPAMTLILPLLKRVERYTMQRATRINLVSEGFRDYFRSICPEGKFSFHPNGIDEEFIGYDFGFAGTDDRPVILYAGNIGAGQGLECILPKAAVSLGENCKIEVIGDGGMRGRLESDIQRLGLENILLLDPMPRARLLNHYRKADYLLLHLNSYRAFHKVLPSKLFEYGATGKPVLAGVAGFAREFVKRELDHAEVFDPCDAKGMIRAMGKLRLGHYPRTEFISKFRRTAIMNRMAGDILECVA